MHTRGLALYTSGSDSVFSEDDDDDDDDDGAVGGTLSSSTLRTLKGKPVGEAAGSVKTFNSCCCASWARMSCFIVLYIPDSLARANNVPTCRDRLEK